jgi:P27 family predicted phage terminase small subunit
MPPYLGEVGRAKWAELLPELEPAGVVTFVDGDVLGMHCLAYEQMPDARAHMARPGGTTIKGSAGTRVVSPLVRIHNRACDEMKRWGAKLGIEAASRARIDVKSPDPGPSVLDEILAANRRPHRD